MNITKDWLASLPYTTYNDPDGSNPVGRYYRQDHVQPDEADVLGDGWLFLLTTDVHELGRHTARYHLFVVDGAFYVVEVRGRTLSRFSYVTVDRYERPGTLDYKLINEAVERFGEYMIAQEGMRA
jgi:hypothetical protein